MSKGNTLHPEITVNFYDNYVPALKDGQFTISLSQALTVNTVQTQKDGGDSNIPAQPQSPITQTFIVSGPRFSLPPGDVSQVFPAAGSSGTYDQYLPQLVLNRQTFPWERDLITSDSTVPWVALLVFAEHELPPPQFIPAGSQQNPNHSTTVTLNDLIHPPSAILGPAITLEDDEDPTQTCNVIDVPVDIFNMLLPSISDLPFLAHTRQVSVENKAITPGQVQDGWFSAVIANRFAVPPTAPALAIGNIVHLVSLEGFEDRLNQTGAPTVSGYSAVRMVSLYSWTYISQADPAENFRTLMLNLLWNDNYTLADLLLRLPLPNPPVTPQDPATTQSVQIRLQDGYAPLRYAMLSGDQTFAWYRGPLSPTPVARFLQDTGPGQPENAFVPLTTGDAMIFDPITGIFDQSYAVAFQTGRSLALANAPFTQSLMSWRAYAHGVVDLILEYMTSSVYAGKLRQDGLIDAAGSLTAAGVTDLAQLIDTKVVTQAFQDFFATAFYQSIAAKIGQAGGFSTADTAAILQEAPPPPTSAAPKDLLDLMQQPIVVALLQQLSGLDDLGTLSSPLTSNAVSLGINVPGTAEAINNGTAILLYSPDGTTSAWVTVSGDTPANSITVAIQAYSGSATLPKGSAMYVQDPSQDAQHVVEWLAQTALLYNVPFNNLVAHPSLLPQESIRFFYIDQNWTDALLDGALSIGVQTGRDALFQKLMRDKLYEGVQDVMAEVRDTLLGINPSGGTPPAVQPAGFLLRSQGVTGWPGLEIRAWSASDTVNPMKPLRLELLASDTLFAIYPDIPTKLTFTEPSEGLVFGVEDDGVEMRYIPGVTGFDSANIGRVIENNGSPLLLHLKAIRTSQRNGENSALNIAGTGGLVGLIETTIQNNVTGQPALTLSPASFAVQMVRVPEQMEFTPAPQP